MFRALEGAPWYSKQRNCLDGSMSGGRRMIRFLAHLLNLSRMFEVKNDDDLQTSKRV